jgi:hypothetical protein
MGKLVYDYYDVDLPSDCCDESERFDLAVNQAREMARLYVMPCEWRLVSDDGESVRVCRVREVRS